MNSQGRHYSQRLGVIRNEQFQAIAEHFSLGRFLRAEPVTKGLFGQNVYLTTSEGEFVLRGAPHWVRGRGEREWRQQDQWQFTKERYFAAALKANTRAPVPWPMYHETSGQIFGWPCLVMPRMPGICCDDPELRQLPERDQLSIARAMGTCLAEMQQLTAPQAGDLDVDTMTLTPFADGDTRFVIEECRSVIAQASTEGLLTTPDIHWMEGLMREAEDIPAPITTYVHVDYKPGNLCLEQTDGVWRISGLFDFHEARFGNGMQDLVRQGCSYLDHHRDLAAAFVQAFLDQRGDDKRIDALMRLFILNDRLKIWAWFARPGVTSSLPVAGGFRAWADRYLAAGILCAAPRMIR